MVVSVLIIPETFDFIKFLNWHYFGQERIKTSLPEKEKQKKK